VTLRERLLKQAIANATPRKALGEDDELFFTQVEAAGLGPFDDIPRERRQRAARGVFAATARRRRPVARRRGAGRPRGRRTVASRAGPGDDPGGDDPPDGEHELSSSLAVPFLAGRDRLLAGSLSRIGTVVG